MLIVQAAVIAGLILLVLDLLWIGVIARDWISGQMGALKRDKIMAAPAVLFYVLYAVGLAVFAVAPAVQDGGWQKAAMLGALLGLVAYGTYDLTNLATVKGWPLPMVVVDMVWGAAISAASCAGAVLILTAI